MSQFPEWLQQLASLGLRADLPKIRIGTGYTCELDLATHPVLGDFTNGAFTMQGKAAPGAEAALATFNVSAGTPSGGVTTVTITLPVAAQSGLTAPVSTGVSALFYDLLFTPSGGSPELASGGVIPVIAGVTS